MMIKPPPQICHSLHTECEEDEHHGKINGYLKG